MISYQRASAKHSPTGFFGGLVRCARFLLPVAVLLMSPWTARADDIRYQYDENGRVIQAANHTTGESVAYAYDEVGNILSQIVTPLNTLSVSYFAPASGPVGTEISLTGTGFSTTPAANAVSVNGVAATVVSASESRLTFAVPSGATTGPITVQVSSSSATTSRSFVVSATANGPQIFSLTPVIGASGATVTIAGANFEIGTKNNRVRFESTSAVITESPTPTTIKVPVPAGAGSGKVRVSTPRGYALSPMDFIVVPSGYSAANVIGTGRVTVDGSPTVVTLPTASRVNIQLFDAAYGDLLSVGVINTSIPSVTLKVYRPDGVLFASGVVTAAGHGLQLPKVSIAGTYTLVVDPGTNTGAISLGVMRPLLLSAAIDGPQVVASLSPAGRRAVVTFTASAGSYANLSLSSVTLANGAVSLIGPDESVLASTTFTTTGKSFAPLLTTTGTYSLLVEPTGSIAGSATVAIVSSASPALVVDGATYNLSLPASTPVNVTFRGEPGQRLSLGIVENGSGVIGANFKVLSPDGTQIATKAFTATNCSGGLGCMGYAGNAVLNLEPLASGGTYTVVAQGTGASAGTLQLTLSTPLSQGLTTNASAGIHIGRPGQSLELTFTGDASQYYSLAFIESQGNIPGADIKVFRPDGTQQDSATLVAPLETCGGFGCSGYTGSTLVNLGPLLGAGTYTVLVSQTKAGDGALGVTLATPKVQAITANSPVNVTAGLPGQGIRFDFAGTAGQYLSLAQFEEGYGSFAGGVVAVFAPDGSLIAGNVFAPTYCPGFGCGGFIGDGAAQMGPLPESGEYSAFLIQTAATTGTISATLATPASGTLSIGTPATVSLPLRGQPIQMTFSATVGDLLSVGVEEVEAGNIEGATITVLRPDGSAVASTEFVPQFSTCGGFGCSGYMGTGVLNLGSISATGTYTLLVQQYGGDTGSLRVTLSSPATTSLPVGSATSVQAPLAGQSMKLQFAGTAGQFFALGFEEEAYGSIQGAEISIVNPQGIEIASGTLSTTYGSCGGFGCAGYTGKGLINFGPLQLSGTYAALVRQKAGDTGTLKFTLSQPAQGSLTPSTPLTVSASQLGQSIQFSFFRNIWRLCSIAGGGVVWLSYLRRSDESVHSRRHVIRVAGLFTNNVCRLRWLSGLGVLRPAATAVQRYLLCSDAAEDRRDGLAHFDR
jgi:trimeric autotransporter adhesin